MNKSLHKLAKLRNWREFTTRCLIGECNELLAESLSVDDPGEYIRYLKFNGIESLLLDSLEQQQKTELLTQALVDQLQSHRRISSVRELFVKKNLQLTIELLNKHGIAALVLKGSALAYSLYCQPYHRSRGDTDILISPEDKAALDKLLIQNGYQKSITVSGDIISHQCTYTIEDDGISHSYDFHWKLTNSSAFADLFSFDELSSRREIVFNISNDAYRLSNIDALLHAIVHYYVHFPQDRQRLIWIYDLHLLCSQIRPSQWDSFIQTSSRKKLDPLVIQAFQLTQSTFNTQLPAHVLQKLKQSSVQLNKIEHKRISAESWSRVDQFRSDWAALSLLQRCKMIKEYLLPPGEFILAQNRSTNKFLLPYFYCKRLFLGGLKVIKNSRAR